MSSEVFKILSMLEEGKITSEEAVKLLNSLYSTEEKNEYQVNDLSDSIEGIIGDFNKRSEEISKGLSKDFDNINKKLQDTMSIDMGKFTAYLESIKSELENIVGRLSNDVANSTDNIGNRLSKETDEIGKKITNQAGSQNNMFNMSVKELEKNVGNISFDTLALSDKFSSLLDNFIPLSDKTNNFSKSYSKEVNNSGLIDLYFECLNGSLSIAVWDEDYIKIDAYCKTSENNIDNLILLIDDPQKYGIKIKESPDSYVSLDVMLPRIDFNTLQILSNNSRARIDNLACKSLMCTSGDGKLLLSSLKCTAIRVSILRGKIEIYNTFADKLFVKGSNCPVIIDGTCCTLSDINTTGDKISMVFPESISGKNEVRLSTENAGIDLELPEGKDIGFYIDAFSLNGSVNILNDAHGVSFSTNKQNDTKSSHLIGQNKEFNNAVSYIKVMAQNTNSFINIK